MGLSYGFQGRPEDPVTGLYYFRARYYDPHTGRFLTRDPVWDPGNIGNPYTFAWNNSISNVDPSGKIVPLILVAMAAGAIFFGTADFAVQYHTTAGFTAGSWEWQSTLGAAGMGAIVGATSMIGGPTAGGALRILARRGLQAAVDQLIDRGSQALLNSVSESEDEGEADDDSLGNCFLAGTLVSMADGTKRPIEEVRAGDRVKAMDPKDGQVVDREVVRTFRNVTDTVVDVTWAPLDRVECMAVGPRGRGERHSVGVARSGGESSEDGEPPSAQTVRCTPGHPWWVEGQQRWVLAGDLRVGDQLRLEDGRLGVVLALASRREAARTFNFEVSELHSYFVTAPKSRSGALVHNASLASVGKALAKARRLVGAVPGAGKQRLGKLARIGQNRWRSFTGLIYGGDPQFGNRARHVLAHMQDDLTKATHGVFATRSARETLALVDEAFAKVQLNLPGITSTVANGRRRYLIPMGRVIGTEGGHSGSGNALEHLFLVVREGTSEVITAFPKVP